MGKRANPRRNGEENGTRLHCETTRHAGRSVPWEKMNTLADILPRARIITRGITRTKIVDHASACFWGATARFPFLTYQWKKELFLAKIRGRRRCATGNTMHLKIVDCRESGTDYCHPVAPFIFKPRRKWDTCFKG